MEHKKIDAMTQKQFEEATEHWTETDWEEYEEFQTTDDVMLCLYEYLDAEYNVGMDVKIEALFERDNELKRIRNVALNISA